MRLLSATYYTFLLSFSHQSLGLWMIEVGVCMVSRPLGYYFKRVLVVAGDKVVFDLSLFINRETVQLDERSIDVNYSTVDNFHCLTMKI